MSELRKTRRNSCGGIASGRQRGEGRTVCAVYTRVRGTSLPGGRILFVALPRDLSPLGFLDFSGALAVLGTPFRFFASARLRERRISPLPCCPQSLAESLFCRQRVSPCLTGCLDFEGRRQPRIPVEGRSVFFVLPLFLPVRVRPLNRARPVAQKAVLCLERRMLSFVCVAVASPVSVLETVCVHARVELPVKAESLRPRV